MSHGNYSLFDSKELSEDNKGYIKKIFADLKTVTNLMTK